MNSAVEYPRCYDFAFPRLDTLVRVEVQGQQVTIRSTKDSFSLQRKVSFVRELVAEGFIDDIFGWFTEPAGEGDFIGVRWIVDYSWLPTPEESRAKTSVFMLRLITGAALLWLVLVALLFRR